MTPKSGNPLAAVAPPEPKAALEACKADPGSVEQAPGAPEPREQTKSDEDIAKSWIEVKLVDEADQPIPGALLKLICSDETVRYGRLDHEGLARVVRIPAGSCKVLFPDLDEEAWEPA